MSDMEGYTEEIRNLTTRLAALGAENERLKGERDELAEERARWNWYFDGGYFILMRLQLRPGEKQYNTPDEMREAADRCRLIHPDPKKYVDTVREKTGL